VINRIGGTLYTRRNTGASPRFFEKSAIMANQQNRSPGKTPQEQQGSQQNQKPGQQNQQQWDQQNQKGGKQQDQKHQDQKQQR